MGHEPSGSKLYFVYSHESRVYNLYICLSGLGPQGQSHAVLQQERRKLPVFRARKKLLKEIIKTDSAIVIGETGSGKTTQIPQVCMGHLVKFCSFF